MYCTEKVCCADYLLIHCFNSLLVRQYDTVGELIRCLGNTYVINDKTTEDVAQMWIALSQIRALLPVQMSQEEEGLMRMRLWYVTYISYESYSCIHWE